MKKIVITGGLGYIGTELCLLYSGYSWFYEIIVIVFAWNFYDSIVENNSDLIEKGTRFISIKELIG